jgi:hypothetical protein
MAMASEPKRERDDASELDWLAFRYVAGEMAVEEAEAFEGRLDQDQEAREAVARVVELAGAVAALAPQAATTLPFRRHPTIRTFIAAATMAAAACLAWLVIHNGGPAPAPSGRRGAIRIAPTTTVALTWSTLDQERAADKGDSGALLASNEDLSAVAESEDSSLSDPGLPPWLVDAAALAARPEHAGQPAKDL